MKRLYDPTGVLVGSACFFVFAFGVFIFSFSPRHAAAEGVASSAQAAASSGIRPLEMHIANNGLVLLRSARVLSANGGTLVLSTAWGSADFKWIVRTDSTTVGAHNFGTRFLDRDGTSTPFLDVHVGELVTVTGTLDSTAPEPTLDADSVRKLQ